MENFIINKKDILSRAIEVKNAYTYGIYFLLKNKKIVEYKIGARLREKASPYLIAVS